MIAMTFALPAESSEFLRRLRNKSRVDRNGVSIVRGTLDDCIIEVLHTGVGEDICRQRISKFVQDQQYRVLISTGFAGALTDELQVGDLLLAKNFSTIELNQSKTSSFAKWRTSAAELLTLPQLIDSAEERIRIAGASGAAAVDMETKFIAATCAARGLPLLALRVITDTPTQPFPAPPGVLFDMQQQRPHIGRLAGFFLIHPARVPGLLHFAKRISRARSILADALVEIARDIE
jgi:nucleoside phosphorylase